MRKARLTEHQIITVLKSVEAGRTVKDVCRETGISETSYYNRKAGVPFSAVSRYIL
ncbi:transposase [Morganella morganii]|nr:transposase [Morganella morganii]KOO17586.1 transposase [Morganella morganii]